MEGLCKLLCSGNSGGDSQNKLAVAECSAVRNGSPDCSTGSLRGTSDAPLVAGLPQRCLWRRRLPQRCLWRRTRLCKQGMPANQKVYVLQSLPMRPHALKLGNPPPDSCGARAVPMRPMPSSWSMDLPWDTSICLASQVRGAAASTLCPEPCSNNVMP